MSIPSAVRAYRSACSSFPTIYRRLAAAMIGDPDVVVDSPLTCSFCHEEKSHCSNCAENLAKSRALPMSQLLRSSQMDFATQSKLLVVEGNIGVGKTTLANKLAAALGYKMIQEPTSENPYLGKFTAYFSC